MSHIQFTGRLGTGLPIFLDQMGFSFYPDGTRGRSHAIFVGDWIVDGRYCPRQQYEKVYGKSKKSSSA